MHINPLNAPTNFRKKAGAIFVVVTATNVTVGNQLSVSKAEIVTGETFNEPVIVWHIASLTLQPLRGLPLMSKIVWH